MIMKKNKGFTLIELLAVIIILGILMMIAIPSITEYISNSRKNAFVVTARQYISGARNKVNSLELPFYDKNITYYLPINCVKLEKGGQSPFGEWDTAYVVVVYDGNTHKYYFAGKDTSNIGMYITAESKITVDVVKTISGDINANIGIGGRSQIRVLDDTCNAESYGDTTPSDDVEEDVVNGGDTNPGGGGNPGGGNPGGGDPDEEPGDLLASLVQVGDYVTYDAGTWPTTIPMPAVESFLSFGGVTAGSSRNDSVACYPSGGGENGSTNPMQSGWRVLKVSGNEVYLIHAGSSECFRMYDNPTHGYINNLPYNSESVFGSYVSGPTNSSYSTTRRTFSEYQNGGYSTSLPIIFTKELLEEYYGTVYEGTVVSDSLIKTNLYYWLATANNSSNLWYVQHNGQISKTNNHTRGIRPVVVLASCVTTTGKGTDAYGHSSWMLGPKCIND